ncbi:hypothetical protein AAY473_004298 [Plecturocebus cupreus]
MVGALLSLGVVLEPFWANSVNVLRQAQRSHWRPWAKLCGKPGQVSECLAPRLNVWFSGEGQAREPLLPMQAEEMKAPAHGCLSLDTSPSISPAKDCFRTTTSNEKHSPAWEAKGRLPSGEEIKKEAWLDSPQAGNLGVMGGVEDKSLPEKQDFKTSLTNMVKLIFPKNTKISQAWWQAPVVPATQEAETELLESRRVQDFREPRLNGEGNWDGANVISSISYTIPLSRLSPTTLQKREQDHTIIDTVSLQSSGEDKQGKNKQYYTAELNKCMNSGRGKGYGSTEKGVNNSAIKNQRRRRKKREQKEEEENERKRKKEKKRKKKKKKKEEEEKKEKKKEGGGGRENKKKKEE